MKIKKVLVVDDDLATRKLLEHRLAREGYEVILAKDSDEAMSSLRTLFFDLILMDIIMPDVDGAEIVQQIKENPKTKNIPIIFISAVVTDQDSGQPEVFIGEVSYPVVSKPLNFEQLWVEMKRVVNN